MQVVRVPVRYKSRVESALVDHKDADRVNRRRWHLSSGGYACASAYRGNYHRSLMLMHRYILGLPIGDPREVDHINGNRLDNRRANLRIVTRAENCQNILPKPHSSRFRNVTYHKGRRKWQALVKLREKSHYLGLFESEEEAAAAAAEFRRSHMPFSREGSA